MRSRRRSIDRLSAPRQAPPQPAAPYVLRCLALCDPHAPPRVNSMGVTRQSPPPCVCAGECRAARQGLEDRGHPRRAQGLRGCKARYSILLTACHSLTTTHCSHSLTFTHCFYTLPRFYSATKMAAKAAELKRISACSSDHSSSLRVQSVTESSQRDSHAEQAGGV